MLNYPQDICLISTNSNLWYLLINLTYLTYNIQMNLPEIQKIMMEFEKQTEMMDMKEEMMDDAIDSALGDDDDEVEG